MNERAWDEEGYSEFTEEDRCPSVVFDTFNEPDPGEEDEE